MGAWRINQFLHATVSLSHVNPERSLSLAILPATRHLLYVGDAWTGRHGAGIE